ncbi:MAG: hypothetical protein JO138_16675 [Acidobacteriaceae bacterium]|nr:hypothetical protein [Acidobacteriaceae bacterium]
MVECYIAVRLSGFLVLVLSCLTACVRHREPNSDCRWPSETGAKPLNLKLASQRQHLSDDAEFAEDLAIRYADTHRGLHTSHFEGIEEYERARDECMAALFETIGTSHDVKEQEVRRSLGHRRHGFDSAVILSFTLFYTCLTSVFARRLHRLYGPREERTTVAVMITIASLLASTAGLMLGEVWSGILESFRIGNGHMSYRLARIPWVHHRLALFISGVILFWVVAAFQRRNIKNPQASNASRAWFEGRPTNA